MICPSRGEPVWLIEKLLGDDLEVNGDTYTQAWSACGAPASLIASSGHLQEQSTQLSDVNVITSSPKIESFQAT